MEIQNIPEVESPAAGEGLRGATLPASWYTSEAVFRLEARAIFSRYWANPKSKRNVSR